MPHKSKQVSSHLLYRSGGGGGGGGGGVGPRFRFPCETERSNP